MSGERPRRQRDILPPLWAALLVILFLSFHVFRPFLLTFTVAACVALLLGPLQRHLSRVLRGRHGLSAVLLVAVTTLAILVPVGTSLIVLGQRALVFFGWLGPRLQPEELERLWRETLPGQFPWLRGWTSQLEGQLAPVVSNSLSQAVSAATTAVQRTVAGFAVAAFDLVLFLLLLFFLLRDGGRLRAELRPVSPFNEAQETLIFDHLGRTVKGALQSLLVVPLLQGIMALPGFLLFGVPQPVTWAVAVALAAMVPLLGSPLGWVPAVVWLFYEGAPTAQWVGMLVYGTVVISGIDNLAKPLLLRGAARIHPLLGFLSIIGGLLAFGLFGFLVGPVILSLVLSALRIYRLDILRAAPAVAAVPAPPEVASPPSAA
jgi:predicted PurR-regulated permease PerM